MEKDYSLRRIGDDWRFLPESELRRKFKYDTLLYNIKRREKRILKELTKIELLRKELREWKRIRTEEYNELIRYHRSLTPTFTISMSKSRKVKNENNSSGLFYTGGNKSWDLFIKLGRYRKSLYLGKNSEVLRILDLIEGRENHYKLLNTLSRKDHYEKVVISLKNLIVPLIQDEMIGFLQDGGEIVNWFSQRDSSRNVLMEIYKSSEYYEEEVVPERKESKGLFWGFENGKPIWKKRKRKNENE